MSFELDFPYAAEFWEDQLSLFVNAELILRQKMWRCKTKMLDWTAWLLELKYIYIDIEALS